jgi:hypothetical protein
LAQNITYFNKKKKKRSLLIIDSIWKILVASRSFFLDIEISFCGDERKEEKGN